MKFSYAVCLVVACLSSPAFSQSLTSPMISVSGSAQIKVVPDEIYLRVGVETRHADLEESKRQNDERVTKAIAFLKANGIASKDIQTDFVAIEPYYDSNVSKTTPQVFNVRKSIEIKMTAIENFERVLTGLLKSGVTHVHGVEFRTSQLRKHRDAARASAVKAATEKANALAAALGVKRGKVHTINANEWGGWTTSSNWGGSYGNQMAQNSVQNAGGDAETTDTLSLGQINVSASVNVSFLIE